MIGFDSSRVFWPEKPGDPVVHLTRKTYAYTDAQTAEILTEYNGQKVEPIAYPYQMISYRYENGRIYGDVEQGVAPAVQKIEYKTGMTSRWMASFVEPFLSNRPEAVHFGQRAGDLVDLALGRRVHALGNLLLEFEPFGARLSQRNGGIDTEGCRRALFAETIVNPPAPLTGFCDEHVKPASIGKLVWLVACNGFSDGQIGQHNATFLSVSIPSIATNLIGCGWTHQPSKTFDFQDFSGHLWTCPEEAMVPEEA